MKKIFWIGLCAAIILAATWVRVVMPYKTEEKIDSDKSSIGMANPAAVNCAKQGGESRMEKTPKGIMGVCYFDDNRQCEEWALFRNECPKGGFKVTGYVTKAARYCKIIGGEYKIKFGWIAKAQAEHTKEPGVCKLPSGKICDVWELWKGDCIKY